MNQIQVNYKLDEQQMKCPICYDTITTTTMFERSALCLLEMWMMIVLNVLTVILAGKSSFSPFLGDESVGTCFYCGYLTLSDV